MPRQIDRRIVTQMSALKISHQADRSNVLKCTLFLDLVTISVNIKTSNNWLDESADGSKIWTCTKQVEVLRKTLKIDNP